MFKKKSILIFALMGAAGFVFAQNNDSLMIKRISDEILVNGKAYGNLRTLCKSVGARLSGSAGMYKAEAWGLKTLKDAGAENVWYRIG
jgi:carboxypeptidase Q